MTKIHKTISVEEDLIKDIEKKKDEYNFNFSEWVDRTYRKDFLGEDVKLLMIKKYEAKILKLKKEIEDTKEKEEVFRESLSRAETRFLYQVPRLIREGKDWKAVCNRFNNTFHRNFDLKTFKSRAFYLESHNNDKPKYIKGKKK